MFEFNSKNTYIKLMELNSLVRKMLSDRNLTINALSKKSGVAYSTVQRFITDDKDIKTDNLISILEALDINIVQLIRDNHLDGSSKNIIPSYIGNSFKDILKGVGIGN